MHRVGIIEACTLPEITTHLLHPSFDGSLRPNLTKPRRFALLHHSPSRVYCSGSEDPAQVWRSKNDKTETKDTINKFNGRTLQTEGLSHLQVFILLRHHLRRHHFRLAALQAGARQDPSDHHGPQRAACTASIRNSAHLLPLRLQRLSLGLHRRFSGSQHRDLQTQQDRASDLRRLF